MMTRATPLPSQASIVARSRMPPPSCTGIFTAARMRSTASAFIGRPAKAPSRSTMWRYSKPMVANARACSAGSRLNTVVRAMSPCSRRTASPFLRSMAEKGSRLPLQEIRDQRETEFLALLGMELRPDDVVARDDRGDGAAVVGFGDEIGAVRRLRVDTSARSRRAGPAVPASGHRAAGAAVRR